MNKKGFTLIELLAVIVILAIIALISTQIIMNTISTDKEKAYYRQVEMVEDAAGLYIANKINSEIEVENYIFLNSLVDAGRLKGVPTDSLHGGNLQGVIKVTQNGSQYDYEYLEVNNTSGEVILLDQTKTVKSIIIEGNSIQETTVQGKNIFSTSLIGSSAYVTKTGLNSLQVKNGYANSSGLFQFNLNPNTVYTCSTNISGTGSLTASFGSIALRNPTTGIMISICEGGVAGKRVKTFTTPADINDFNQIYIYGSGDTTATVNIDNIQLELGSTATTFESFIPNSPSQNYQKPIKDVIGNIIVDGNVFSTIPTLRKVLTTKDTYNLISGEYIKRVEVSNISSSTVWNDWNTSMRRVLHSPIPNKAVGYNSLGLFTAGTVLNTGMGSNNSSTIGLYSLNNISYWYPSYYQMGLSGNETKTVADATLQTWLTNNPVYYSYILATPITTNLGTKTIPNGSKYIYLDSEVAANIIVEYQ